MAEPAPPPDYHRCHPAPEHSELPGAFNCGPETGSADYPWWFTKPGRPDPSKDLSDERRKNGVSQGLNFGVILLPYVRDWGNASAGITYRKAAVTALKTFPSAYDRVFCMGSAAHFVKKNDQAPPKLWGYLVQSRPFVGWRWGAQTLKIWLIQAERLANELGPPDRFLADGALKNAIVWCYSVREQFEILSKERFPYSPPDLVNYWRARTVYSLVPGTFGVPADFKPTPGRDADA